MINNMFKCVSMDKVSTWVLERKEVRELSYISVLSLLYYCLQEDNFGIGSKWAKVFATANDINRLSKSLQSRFRSLFLLRFTEEQFLDVSEKVLPKTSHSIARYIGAAVLKNQ